MKSIRTYVSTALALLKGERCVVCGAFQPGAGLCPRCLLRLPYAGVKGAEGNPVERLFWWRVPVVRASAMLTYRPGNEVERLLHAIKYSNRPDLAVEMGTFMAQELLPSGFFAGIDCIQPIPLHPNRQRQRGYNQSERLAQGISEVTGIPLVDFVRRVRDNVSQTQLSHNERRSNVEGIFTADEAALVDFAPHHILFVDDVITTGATTISCVQAITGTDGVPRTVPPRLRVSLLSLAFAGQFHVGRLTIADLHLPDYTESNAYFRERLHQQLF